MSYVHDDQHGSLLGRGVRDRAVLLGCRVDLPTMSMGAWTDWHAVVMDDPEEAVSVLREQDQAIERLTAENAALRKDAEARSLYDRTAAAQGFTNAPHWNELAEETRQMYRDERAKRDAAMGESHAE